MPTNEVRSDKIAGGTAVAQESNTGLWIGLGALLLVVAGVVYASTRDRSEKASTTEAASAVVEVTEPGQTAAEKSPGPGDDEVGISLDEAPPSPSELREQALASFKQSLDKARLWSKLTAEGSTVSLVSGACADQSMQPTIALAAESLAAVGITAIRCLEKHGEQVFEQSL